MFSAAPWKRTLVWLGGLALLLFAFFATHQVYWRTALTTRQIPIMTWGYFHYELNARYFKELRYTDLYACAIEADRESGKRYPAGHFVRDLDTYDYVAIERYKPCPRERFTEARWKAFVEDIDELAQATTYFEGLYADQKELYWRFIIIDKGYNAPPPLVVLSQLTLWITDMAGPWSRPLSSLVDVVWMLAAFFVCYRVFGARAAYWSAFVFMFFFGTSGMLLGALWQYVWLASLMLMLAAVKQKSWKMAGFWIGFATATRVFPVFFLVPFVWRWWVAWREKHQEERIAMQQVGYAFCFTMIAFCVLGLCSGLGMEGWTRFFPKMQMHSAYIVGELFDIGWKNMVATYLVPVYDDFARLEAYASWKWAANVFAVVATAAIVWRNRRASLERLLLIPLPLLFLWTVLSPYYYLILALVPLVLFGWAPHRPMRKFSLGDTWLFVLLLTILFIHFHFIWMGVEYTATSFIIHRASEGLIALYMFSLAFLCGHSGEARG